jgi:membrane protease YdiL (CAAX protease family)
MSSVPPPRVPPPSVPPPTAAPDSPTPLVERPGSDLPPWQLWTAPAAIATGFAVGLLGNIVVAIVAAAAGASIAHPTPAVLLFEDLVFDLSFVATAIYFARLQGSASPADFGYRRIAWKLGIGGFLLAGISYYVVTDIYATLVNLHGSDKLPNQLGVSKSTAALIGAALFVCVIAPIAEEFFFRGFIFGALRHWRIRIAGRDYGTLLAAIVTGVLFGLAHTGSASSQYLIPLGFLGFALCVVRWRTGSLYPCMALHSVNNSLALGINQEHWSALAILGLIVGALLAIAAITLPLAPRTRVTAV